MQQVGVQVEERSESEKGVEVGHVRGSLPPIADGSNELYKCHPENASSHTSSPYTAYFLVQRPFQSIIRFVIT